MQRYLPREIKESLKLWLPVAKRVWFLVLVFGFIETGMSVIFSQLSARETALFLMVGLLALAISLLMFIVENIVVNQVAWDVENKKKTPLMKSLNDNFKYVTIESMRAMMPVLLKTLFLVVPGIIECIRLYWVVYIVQFDKDYQAGKVDALEKSRELVRGRFWSSFAILLFTLLLSMVSLLFGNEMDLLNKPLLLGFSMFVSVILQIWGYILLYCYYQNIKQRG